MFVESYQNDEVEQSHTSTNVKNLALYFIPGGKAEHGIPNGFAKSTLSLPYLPGYIYNEEGDSTLKFFLLMKFMDVHIYFFFCKEYQNSSAEDCISLALQNSCNVKRSKASCSLFRFGFVGFVFFFSVDALSVCSLCQELRRGEKITLAFFPILFWGAFPCYVYNN